MNTVINILKREESYRRFAYKDTKDIWTIGYGTNIELGGQGIPKELAIKLVTDPNAIYHRFIYDGNKIGYGTVIDRTGTGIPEDIAEALLIDWVNKCSVDFRTNLRGLFKKLNDVRRDVITMMIYQMGINSVLDFKKMIKALMLGDYKEASKQMLLSKWAIKDSPARAKRMSRIILEGKY
jgi:lysozyme